VPISYPPGTAWPPTDWENSRSLRLYHEYEAWYSSDPEKLWSYYSNQPASAVPYPVYRPSQFQPGLIGFLARFFWGRPLTPGQSTTHSHVPAAADVSALSRSLLWAEPPAFTVPDQDHRIVAADGVVSNNNPAQELLEDVLDKGGWYATFSEAAEISSAYGGAYIRAQANVDWTEVPTGDVITPDYAVPQWGPGGMLVAVTFWRPVHTGADSSSSGPVMRHLERHEMIGGVCVVTHALFLGSADKLGRLTTLADGDAECQRLAALVGPDGSIVIGTTLLDVQYLPNLRPHRIIKGTPLGRSDYQGLTGKFDELDEVWSSLMRDVRNGKGRLVVPNGYLRSLGPGKGATFDPEQEIFTGVNTEGPDQPLQIQIAQFAIRVDDHIKTAEGLWRTITRGAGLSADAFGEQESDGPAMTATQVNAKSSRTAATRGDKISYATPPLRRLCMVLLQLAQLYYRSGVDPSPVQLEWPDAAAPDPMKVAQTLQFLEAAKAISTREKVSMLHPDWAAEDIDEEVALIKDENAPPAPVEQPGTFTGVEPTAEPGQGGEEGGEPKGPGTLTDGG
jgi:hypothetical protein